MHLLETDASTYVSLCFMDSPIVRKTDEKSSMIETPYRPRNAAFSSVPTPFSLMGTLCKTQVPFQNSSPVHNLPSQGNESAILEEDSGTMQDREVPNSPFLPTKDDQRREKNTRCSDEQIYDASGLSHAVENGGSNLTGFINGFIVQAPTDKTKESTDSRIRRQSNLTRSPIRTTVKVENPRGNENSNNNRIQSDGLRPGEGRPHPDTATEERRKPHQPSHASDRLEYRQPDDYDETDGNKTLNGSDILKRMYASFGTHFGTANRLLGSSSEYKSGPINQHARDIHHELSDMNENLSKYHSDKKINYDNVNENKPKAAKNTSAKSSSKTCSAHTNQVSSCTSKKPVSQNKSQDFCRSTTKTSVERFRGATRTDNDVHDKSPLCKNRSKQVSPSHSIHSLLSGGCYTANEHPEEVCRSSEKNYEGGAKRTSLDSQHKKKRERSFESNVDSEAYPHCGASHEGSPKRPRVSEREAYNEKSREIFRRDKEIIENSIRQNYTGLNHEHAVHSPPWLNASAMAAFQANLLSSLPQNGTGALNDPGLFLKSASLAAAASASPLMLGVNPCFVNPYLLRNLPGGDVAAAAAYHQAMAQGLLQNHPALNPLLNPGSHGVYPSLSHLGYGGIPFADSSPIAAAIAASVRQNAASFYTNPTIPYPILPQQVNHLNEGTMPGMDPLNSGASSPSRSPQDNGNVIYSPRGLPGAMGVEASFMKHRRRSDETKTDSSTMSRKDSIGQINENATRLSGKPLPLAEQSNISKLQDGICRPSSPSLPALHKRKSPSSLPPDNYIASKKKLCTIKHDSSYKKIPKEFPPISPLKSTKAKNGDGAKTPHLSVNKPQGSAEKSSSARPSSYKNLTRERRLVANARERTRVHTISSAFEELRQQIPSYSCNQKLSKLAILRIACSYIQSLSVLAGRSTEGTFKDSVDQCTRVLQAESRARSRRKSNKAQIEWEVANYEKGPGCDAESEKKADVPCLSRETPPWAATHGLTTGSLLSHEGIAQVHDESEYRRPDDSRRTQSDSSENIPYRVNTARSEDSKDSGNRSNENVIEDNAMTANNSLDASGEQIKGSPVNDADGSAWANRSQGSPGDNGAGRDTWRSSPAESPGTQTQLGQIVPASPQEGDYESWSETNPDDQQNDLINVED